MQHKMTHNSIKEKTPTLVEVDVFPGKSGLWKPQLPEATRLRGGEKEKMPGTVKTDEEHAGHSSAFSKFLNLSRRPSAPHIWGTSWNHNTTFCISSLF
jgi:hypothetical protein